MPEERTVEETVGTKRLLRDYSADGKLLRIRIAPAAPALEAPTRSRLGLGRAQSAPSRPTAERAPTNAAPAEAPAPPAVEKPRAIRTRFTSEPEAWHTIDIALEPLPDLAPLPKLAPRLSPSAPSPEPVIVLEPEPTIVLEPEPTPAPAPTPRAAAPARKPIHARLENEAAEPGTLDVTLEPLSELTPLPTLAPPAAAPVVFHEPEPLPAAKDVEAEPVEPPPSPREEPERIEAPRRLARFEILAIEPVEKSAPPAAPEIARPEAEPAAQPEPNAEVPHEPAIPPAPEPQAATPPAPEPPRSYVALVPDLDTRVDALLAREDAPAKRRKRAPIPAPSFEPLRREPWEERLDAAIGAQ